MLAAIFSTAISSVSPTYIKSRNRDIWHFAQMSRCGTKRSSHQIESCLHRQKHFQPNRTIADSVQNRKSQPCEGRQTQDAETVFKTLLATPTRCR